MPVLCSFCHEEKLIWGWKELKKICVDCHEKEEKTNAS